MTPQSADAGDNDERSRVGVADSKLSTDVQLAGEALLKLATSSDPHLASVLARLVQAVAAEASRTQRFARALSRALEEPSRSKQPTHDRDNARRGNRRSPGPIDPFAIFAEGGEPALREQLATLDLEQLRDIVAEHGMDHDRLAMKWKDLHRIESRIIERVAARASKGSAFRRKPRGATSDAPPEAS